MDLEKEVIGILKKHGITYALTYPCAKIKRLLTLTPKHFKHIPLSREEEGVGIAAGIHLANERAVMMLQSGGVGNSLNALLSLAIVYKIPIPMIISWRGIYKEKIEAQLPVGEFLPAIFNAVKLPYVEIRQVEDFEKIDTILSTCFSEMVPAGIFISPEFWEKSKISDTKNNNESEIFPNREKGYNLQLKETSIKQPIYTRFQMIESIKDELVGKAIMSNIGIPSKELYHIIDQPSNFYMLGSLGLVSAIGLGVAVNTDREIIVIDGDASFLTNPNIFGTITQEKERCSNLTILLIDNGTCGSTGNQITAAYNRIDLELLARAYGFENTTKVYTTDSLRKVIKTKSNGPRFVHAIVKPSNAKVENIPFTALDIKRRFQKSFNK